MLKVLYKKIIFLPLFIIAFSCNNKNNNTPKENVSKENTKDSDKNKSDDDDFDLELDKIGIDEINNIESQNDSKSLKSQGKKVNRDINKIDKEIKNLGSNIDGNKKEKLKKEFSDALLKAETYWTSLEVEVKINVLSKILSNKKIKISDIKKIKDLKKNIQNKLKEASKNENKLKQSISKLEQKHLLEKENIKFSSEEKVEKIFFPVYYKLRRKIIKCLDQLKSKYKEEKKDTEEIEEVIEELETELDLNNIDINRKIKYYNNGAKGLMIIDSVLGTKII